ncbi:tRNA (adenosine(37)-N6)-threonylcarbamoyltransferase complex ATPase subunit type 1 TsaE [Microbacterium excoecariae]|uniref:tRNA (adenosine(37)-N6)-threonylcarbamoyltransferase complex ATPase subunit type 1 TsaE n=1 Tax=Microbacterium excoecariae TaxID=2715210 RepID=UPI00140AB8D0|nr:tRNA (adenosine(37)-N6)-threonylcarbamoyltransferase complex ATPase subunit type 1 TsaE [Microbacterium excoecariae]NHI17657.1 tRNA (adenosine(37)-N6)-threonylcarbamoyltransferase complex ATPase subunit type 1 TsaE [Microbacterium excoecariae]
MVPDEMLGEYAIATAEEMEELGRRIGRGLRAGDVLVLTGPLGAGKTTLTRGIADGLGVRGPVQSPTFVIARTHPSVTGGPPLVHADAYRLGDASELEDLGLDLEGSVTILEWGRGSVQHIADAWWDIEIARPVGDAVDDPENLDLDAPRTAVITRHTA